MLTSTRKVPSHKRGRNNRRRRLLTRALPLLVLAIAAFVVGLHIAGGPGRAERKTVTDYVLAWQRGDYKTMYSLLDSTSQKNISEPSFAAVIQRQASTATETALRVVKVGQKQHGTYLVRTRVKTRLFGTLPEMLQVPVTGSGSSARVDLQRQLLFPGLRAGEYLHRTSTLPPRGTLLANDGEVLAEGPDRTSPIPNVASEIVGDLGPIPADQKAHFEQLGYPADAKVGQDGLERIFQDQLGGTPGGQLLAGSRVLASVKAVAAKPVKTTINPSLELAAIGAEDGKSAGIVVMNPKTGGLEALAGFAFSVVQPPGSTMKIITASAALTAGITTLNTEYADSTGADLDGYNLGNANGEDCGGTLLNAFAVSCNSVFAPLGAKVGAAKFVGMAEKFGFNSPSAIAGAAESTLPSAATIGNDLAVGSSAIGQGMVQASALEMTDVAATIADGGRRPIPTLAYGQKPQFTRVITPKVASEVQQMMIAVVESSVGTGYTAQIPGVEIAGKTGTAELTSTQGASAANNPDASSASNTDSWFVAYAPVGHEKVVVGALFPNQGAGAETAAPAVRGVIESALGIG